MFRSAATAFAASPRHCCLVATVTQVTWQQICSPACDPDLADPPTPLAAGAGGAAALQLGGSVTLALAGREGVQEH
jgi:hypothetical protein